MQYEVKFYDGDYKERQEKANDDKCVCYVEQHFNSSANKEANYSVVIVGDNASGLSQAWGRWYAEKIAESFGLPLGGDNGIMIGGYDGGGNENLIYTHMPAVLLEPFFISNPAGAQLVRDEQMQSLLAQILVRSIKQYFPTGGRVAFSVGHKGKRSKPHDRGAILYGSDHEYEADCAEYVLELAKYLLEAAI